MTNASRIRKQHMSLAGYVMFGVILFCLLGLVRAALTEVGVGESLSGGVLTGVLAGGIWYWQAQRRRCYRASVHPADRLLRWPSLDAAQMPLSSRRYRMAVGLRIIAGASALALSSMAVWACIAPDAPVGIMAGMWAIAGISWVFAWSVWQTYTDVHADGLVVRTPLRRQRIGWAQLHEVRWHREDFGDLLVFRTIDGRDIKSTAVVAVDAGFGARRMLQLLDDIERAWAAGDPERVRRGLLTQLATGLRSHVALRAAVRDGS